MTTVTNPYGRMTTVTNNYGLYIAWPSFLQDRRSLGAFIPRSYTPEEVLQVLDTVRCLIERCNDYITLRDMDLAYHELFWDLCKSMADDAIAKELNRPFTRDADYRNLHMCSVHVRLCPTTAHQCLEVYFAFARALCHGRLPRFKFQVLPEVYDRLRTLYLCLYKAKKTHLPTCLIGCVFQFLLRRDCIWFDW